LSQSLFPCKHATLFEEEQDEAEGSTVATPLIFVPFAAGGILHIQIYNDRLLAGLPAR
jgi:hypothetical protein